MSRGFRQQTRPDDRPFFPTTISNVSQRQRTRPFWVVPCARCPAWEKRRPDSRVTVVRLDLEAASRGGVALQMVAKGREHGPGTVMPNKATPDIRSARPPYFCNLGTRDVAPPERSVAGCTLKRRWFRRRAVSILSSPLPLCQYLHLLATPHLLFRSNRSAPSVPNSDSPLLE